MRSKTGSWLYPVIIKKLAKWSKRRKRRTRSPQSYHGIVEDVGFSLSAQNTGNGSGTWNCGKARIPGGREHRRQIVRGYAIGCGLNGGRGGFRAHSEDGVSSVSGVRDPETTTIGRHHEQDNNGRTNEQVSASFDLRRKGQTINLKLGAVCLDRNSWSRQP